MMSNRRPRFRRIVPGLVVLVAAASFPAQASAAPTCKAVRVPVTVSGLPDAAVFGKLCGPSGRARAVQLLVHGATYNHHYWDWPQEPSRYSYVRKAVAAGYATFNIDRLGAGASAHPSSELLTIERSTQALHEVIRRLRGGAIGGEPYRRVIWVGHSFGSLFGWLEASTFGDVDAFVLTGVAHSLKPSWLGQALDHSYSAALDPKFARAGFDPGYLTTRPGTRGGDFYYAPTADPHVIAVDEWLKDTVASTELAGGIPLLSSPPAESSPSRSIGVPTLLVLRSRDALFCGPPDGPDCTAANVLAREAPYYSPEARLTVQVAPETGHDLQLHRTAPRTSDQILGWIGRL